MGGLHAHIHPVSPHQGARGWGLARVLHGEGVGQRCGFLTRTAPHVNERTPQRWSRRTLQETTLKNSWPDTPQNKQNCHNLPNFTERCFYPPSLSLSLARSLPEQRCFRPKTYDHSAVETTRCIIMLQRRKLHKVIIKIQEHRNEKVPNIQYKKQTTRSTLVRRLRSLQIDSVWRIGGGLERGVKQ